MKRLFNSTWQIVRCDRWPALGNEADEVLGSSGRDALDINTHATLPQAL